MCYCFTVLAVHLSYVSHAELHSLSHVVCSHTPDLCSLLLSHVFASIYFQLSFLFSYLDNHVCYLVLQSLDQLVIAPLLNSLVPPSPSPPESTPSAQLLLPKILSCCQLSRFTILQGLSPSSRVPASGPLSSHPGLLFSCPRLSFLCPGLTFPLTQLSP